jgi:hypothetical protein
MENCANHEIEARRQSFRANLHGHLRLLGRNVGENGHQDFPVAGNTMARKYFNVITVFITTLTVSDAIIYCSPTIAYPHTLLQSFVLRALSSLIPPLDKSEL